MNNDFLLGVDDGREDRMAGWIPMDKTAEQVVEHLKTVMKDPSEDYLEGYIAGAFDIDD